MLWGQSKERKNGEFYKVLFYKMAREGLPEQRSDGSESRDLLLSGEELGGREATEASALRQEDAWTSSISRKQVDWCGWSRRWERSCVALCW